MRYLKHGSKLAACALLSLGLPAAYAADPTLIQNAASRVAQSLDGKWNVIVDPYENGYYDYRHEPYDAASGGRGG